jgi:hypothetical protein
MEQVQGQVGSGLPVSEITAPSLPAQSRAGRAVAGENQPQEGIQPKGGCQAVLPHSSPPGGPRIL